jgi:hypothetical protein
MIGMGKTSFPGHSATDLRLALETRQTQAVGTRQLNWRDFIIQFIPRLALRYAGWVTWNAAPSEPLRLAWSGFRGERLRTRRISPGTYSPIA